MTVEDWGETVHLSGDAWKSIRFDTLGLSYSTYTVAADTVLSFDFYSPAPPEIAAIGLDNNNTGNAPIRYFQLAGTESGTTYVGLAPGASYGGGWQHYEIRLADFAGAYAVGNPLNRFTFTNDDDGASQGGESFFRNIRLYESTPPLESVHYTYDAEGRRVARSHDPDGGGTQPGTSQYFVYDGDELAMTFEGATGSASVLTHRYMYGPGVDQALVDEVFKTVGTQQVSDEVLWLLADHQGTIRDIVDDNLTLRKHTEYDSFGRITGEQLYAENGTAITATHAEAIDQLFTFQGREIDEATGLTNHRARWYDPRVGRFLSEDPIGFDSGDPNLYRYAENNPVTNTDPTGLFTLKPIDYLPALGGSRGGVDVLGIDSSLANISLTGPRRSASTSPSGSLFGAAIYNAAVHGPTLARTAVGAGVALAAAGVSLAVPGDDAGSRPTRAVDLMREFNTHQRASEFAAEIRPELEAAANLIVETNPLTGPWLTNSRVIAGYDWLRDTTVSAQERFSEGLQTYGAIGVGVFGAIVSQYKPVQKFLFAADDATAVAGDAGKINKLASSPRVQTHHLMTNKNSISTAAGGPFTPEFERLASRRGITLNQAINNVRLPGHTGPHPAYNAEVYEKLSRATRGLKGEKFDKAFDKVLNDVRTQTLTPGTTLNKLATGQGKGK